ncbi:hypothetical protein NIES37_27330 [Tolypothrix tenuis PCC 7101]|uniref:Uncharacterized protein n=1 Tax=Tolypothrix tenuis PCC 7101 TaxID=231146 RepID=A0A1Z4MZJ4_9CYAN|nr:hypothetical protein NIES37_27330 [Tolypothrix tenuis PCC 7101]BAZ77301.1 hypothetical protein NIES50_59300 [Aulosira laxa NIES-50]
MSICVVEISGREWAQHHNHELYITTREQKSELNVVACLD